MKPYDPHPGITHHLPDDPFMYLSGFETDTPYRSQRLFSGFDKQEYEYKLLSTRRSSWMTGTLVREAPMIQEFAEQEYFVLHLLSVSDEPLGAGSIREELTRSGMKMSEASVGRFLRNLDTRGITSRVGFQGRIITPLGEERLCELLSEREKIVSTDAFLDAVRSREKDMLLEILVARRAIEREMAALAAASRNRSDIASLRAILDRQNSLLAKGEPMASTDPEFHEEVARISGNKVLQSAIEIIRRSGEGASFFEYVRTKVGSAVGADHETIFEAISAGDPEAAATAMTRHIDNIIRDVRAYCKKHLRAPSGKESLKRQKK